LTYQGRQEWLGAAVDVTERNRAAAKVRDTQEFLDTIVENVPVSIIVKNADDCRYVLVNRSTEKLLGMTREALLGKTTYDVLAKPAADAVMANDREVLERDQSYFDEMAIETLGNGTRVVNSTRIVLRADGRPK